MPIEINDLARLVEPLRKRAQLAITRAILKLVNDSTGLQRVQVEAYSGDVRDEAERFQNYGFSSVPFAGAEAVAAAVGGTTSHTIIVVCDDRRFRLRGLENGEVAVYDDQNQVIKLRRDGVEITTHLPVTVNAETLNVTTTADVVISSGGNAAISVAGSATLAAGALARIQAANVQIVGTSSLKLDAGGYGETWLPSGRQTWTQGTGTTNMGPPAGPEHP